MYQAYFSVNTARCAGAPAAYVAGAGKLEISTDDGREDLISTAFVA